MWFFSCVAEGSEWSIFTIVHIDNKRPEWKTLLKGGHKTNQESKCQAKGLRPTQCEQCKHSGRGMCIQTECFFLKVLFIYLLDRGKGRERVRETSMCGYLSRIPFWGPATQACVLTRNWTSDPLVCRLVLSPLSHTSQGPDRVLLLGLVLPPCWLQSGSHRGHSWIRTVPSCS